MMNNSEFDPMKQTNLIGSYHNKPIEIYTGNTKFPSNTVTIFVQGLYGVFSMEEIEDKINLLSKKLISDNISHCVNYNSSRDFSFIPETEHEERAKAFVEKTFEQELDDLKKVVSWAMDNSKKIFGIEKDNLVLNINGNSIGGTLAILLKEFFQKIKKISLCGSGCGTNGSTKPILSSHPAEEIILDSVKTFTGELFLLQGGEDTKVPKESGLKILKNASLAKTTHIIVPGANHNFSKMYGMNNKKAEKHFVQILFDFLSKI